MKTHKKSLFYREDGGGLTRLGDTEGVSTIPLVFIEEGMLEGLVCRDPLLVVKRQQALQQADGVDVDGGRLDLGLFGRPALRQLHAHGGQAKRLSPLADRQEFAVPLGKPLDGVGSEQ